MKKEDLRGINEKELNEVTGGKMTIEESRKGAIDFVPGVLPPLPQREATRLSEQKLNIDNNEKLNNIIRTLRSNGIRIFDGKDIPKS